MTAFDPDTYLLEADLSRADVRVLYQYCHGRKVVEFGSGGSTVLLAQFVESLISYDTDPDWSDRARRRLSKESPEVQARCDLRLVDSPPRALEALPRADVYFVDGWVPDRPAWVAAAIDHRLAETILVHDSRVPVIGDIAPLLVYPRTLALRSLEYHVSGSNMLVIRCGAPCEYVNWCAEEPENRLPFLS